MIKIPVSRHSVIQKLLLRTMRGEGKRIVKKVRFKTVKKDNDGAENDESRLRAVTPVCVLERLRVTKTGWRPSICNENTCILCCVRL